MSRHIRNIERAHIHTYVPSLFIIIMVTALVLDALFPSPLYLLNWATEMGVFFLGFGTILVHEAHLSSQKIRRDIQALNDENDEDEVDFFVGPYAYVRHPGYIGLVLIGFGIAFFVNSAIILASSLLFYVVARTIAIHEENHLLHEDSHVRNEYAEYSKKVKRYF